MVVAEMSGNHNNSLRYALKTIEEAAKCGVDAIKFQTYTADTITIRSRKKDFLIKDKKSPWYGKNLYDLYKIGSTPWEWHPKLFKKAKECGILAFSTPFDVTAVDFLEKLNVPCYKISSFENTFHHLIKKVSKTNKPLIISTGLATKQEIAESVKVAKKNNCKKLILLKCVSSYPADPADVNLKTLLDMKFFFKCEVGFSDHTLGMGSAISSIALGACLIEKHFTLSRKKKTVDSKFSMEPQEMKMFVSEIKSAWKSLGTIKYGPSRNELNSKKFRRSLYIVKNIRKGNKIKSEHLRAIRPGFGLPSKFYNKVIGKKAKKNIDVGTALKMKLIK